MHPRYPIKSIADQLPPEIARQIDPDRRKNEAEYWAVRDQLLDQYVGQRRRASRQCWVFCLVRVSCRPVAAAAARLLGKPVKLVLSRKMMFQPVSHRLRTQQRVRLGATPDGKLVSLQHDYVYQRSMLDAHHEDCGEAASDPRAIP